MQTYIVAFFLAVAVAAILDPVVARLARRKGGWTRPASAKCTRGLFPIGWCCCSCGVLCAGG